MNILIWGKSLASKRSTILKVTFKAEMFVFAFVSSLLWWLIPQIYFQENQAIYTYFIFPLFLFLVSCIIGIKIVLKNGLKSVIIPLFLGSLASSVALIYYMISRFSLLKYPDVIFSQVLITTFYSMTTFFVSFTAMTISIINFIDFKV
jgi:hypothetical protein